MQVAALIPLRLVGYGPAAGGGKHENGNREWERERHSRDLRFLRPVRPGESVAAGAGLAAR
jgi:hypothetical protein